MEFFLRILNLGPQAEFEVDKSFAEMRDYIVQRDKHNVSRLPLDT